MYHVFFVSHSLDMMCLMYFCAEKLIAIGFFHVDDVLLAFCRVLFPVYDFLCLFDWGHKLLPQ